MDMIMFRSIDYIHNKHYVHVYCGV